MLRTGPAVPARVASLHAKQAVATISATSTQLLRNLRSISRVYRNMHPCVFITPRWLAQITTGKLSALSVCVCSSSSSDPFNTPPFPPPTPQSPGPALNSLSCVRLQNKWSDKGCFGGAHIAWICRIRKERKWDWEGLLWGEVPQSHGMELLNMCSEALKDTFRESTHCASRCRLRQDRATALDGEAPKARISCIRLLLERLRGAAFRRMPIL